MNKIPKPNYESAAAHSEYSPSGSSRWIHCPASIQVIREMDRPDSGGDNFFAQEGTAAHELGSFCLDESIAVDSQEGNIFNDIEADREMCKYIQGYVDYVNNACYESSILWVENRLSLEHIRNDMFGTADAIIWNLIPGTNVLDELEVIDLKYGRGVAVEIEDNSQLMLYAIGALAHLFRHGVEIKEGCDIKFTIYQPRCPHVNGTVRSDYKTVAQLRDFQKEVVLAIELSEEEEPYFGPTEHGCRWCPVAPVCKAYTAFNLEQAKIEFSDFKMAPDHFKKKLMANVYTVSELATVLSHIKAITQWCKFVEGYAIEQMKQAKPMKGWKLVYGRSNRAWKDEGVGAAKALVEYGTDEERMWKKKFITPAVAEKELTEGEWLLVKDFIHKPQGKITLAPERDGRDAIDFNEEAKSEWEGEV